MATKRLLNCDFVNASKFKTRLSNKAKLLFFFMFANADGRGFVDTTEDIIQDLKDNDSLFHNPNALDLVENSYESALIELIQNGLILEFTNRHNEKTHLIRHWYFHNKFIKNMDTNYEGFLKQVKVIDNEYELVENHGRETKKGIEGKEMKGNENNEGRKKENTTISTISSKSSLSSSSSQWDKITQELEQQEVVNEDKVNDDGLPF